MLPAESTATFGITEGYDLKKQNYWFRRRWSFRVWQVVLFVFVVVLVIAALAFLMAMYGPGNVNLRYGEAKGTATPDKVTEANDRETAATTSNEQTQTQATTKEPTSTESSTAGVEQPTTNANESTTPRPTTSGEMSLQCGVAIVGGGTAGLLMTDILLRSKNETSVCLFEKENRLGGRIYDHFFSEAPNVSVGLGFWNVMGEHMGEVHLFDYFHVGRDSWIPEIKRVEARGAVEDTYSKLKAKAFPTLLHRYPTNNETLSKVALYVSDNDHAPVKNTSQFSTAGTFLSYYLSPEGAEFLEDVYGFNGDYMQSINPGSYTSYLNEMRILKVYPDDNDRPAKGMSELIKELNRTTQALGAKVFTREPVKSINKDGDTFLIKTTNFTVTANKTVIAVGPSAIKEIDGNVAKSIARHKILQSIVGVPEFQGAAVYAEAWWNDSTAHQKNNSLEPLQMFISNSDCLGITMPYGGGGPNNERVLHTVSTNGECSDKWGNILKMSKTDLDTEVKRALEYKFGREVPDAIDTVYKYWDEGVWFLQQPGANFSEVELREWAKRPLAGSSVHLVGGAYSNFGGWLQDTLLSVDEALKEGWNTSLPFSLYIL